MNVSTRPKLRVLLYVLALVSLGLFIPVGGAEATPGGTVVAWGCAAAYDYGQCTVPSGLSGVTAIAAGEFHSLALENDGTVIAWGCSADFGQCSVPSGLSSVAAIAASAYHSLALKSDGTVVAWGCGLGADYGQCTVPSGLGGVTAIAAGAEHSLALKGDGTVVAWGCGIGADYGQCSVPSGLSGVTAIAAGYFISVALKSDGSVVAWGCGTSFVEWCSVPSGLTATAIAAGGYHGLALRGNGSVVAWGCNPYPVGQCSVPSGLSGVTGIAAALSHSLALKGDGSVVAWGCGSENAGQCDVPAGLSSVSAVAAGRDHSLALIGAPPNRSPVCSGVTTTPGTLKNDKAEPLVPIALAGASDPDGDPLVYQIDGVTQDEPATGKASPDAAFTAAGASSNQVLVRAEADGHLNGRVYRIAFTVSDGKGGRCSGTAGPRGNTTAKVSVPAKKDKAAIDDGNGKSWDSFTGVPVP